MKDRKVLEILDIILLFHCFREKEKAEMKDRKVLEILDIILLFHCFQGEGEG